MWHIQVKLYHLKSETLNMWSLWNFQIIIHVIYHSKSLDVEITDGQYHHDWTRRSEIRPSQTSNLKHVEIIKVSDKPTYNTSFERSWIGDHRFWISPSVSGAANIIGERRCEWSERAVEWAKRMSERGYCRIILVARTIASYWYYPQYPNLFPWNSKSTTQPNFSCQKSHFFWLKWEKVVFPQNNPLDTHIALLETLNAFLINLLETFTDSTNVFQSKFGNGERLHFITLQKSSWKRSPGHVEINFENRAEVYFAKDPNFFGQCTKMIEKISFQIFFLLSTFLWTPRMQICWTCWNFLPKSHFFC